MSKHRRTSTIQDRRARNFQRRNPGWTCHWNPHAGLYETWTQQAGRTVGPFRDTDLGRLEDVADGRVTIDDGLDRELAALIRSGIRAGLIHTAPHAPLAEQCPHPAADVTTDTRTNTQRCTRCGASWQWFAKRSHAHQTTPA